MVRIISFHDLDGYPFESGDLRVDGIVFEREPILTPTLKELRATKPHVPIAPLPLLDLSSLGESLTGSKTCKRHSVKNGGS